MRSACLAAVLALLAAALLFSWCGVRPFHVPHPPVRIEPGAGDYWVELRQGAGFLRHKWGGSWPIPLPYGGEAGSLSLVDLPGLDRRMLVLRLFLGAGLRRQAVWEASSFGKLRPVADGMSLGDVPDATFEDVDGDGREDFALHQRSLRRNPGDPLDPEDWVIRTTYHAWTGARFEPRWVRLQALGTPGPLVPLESPPP